MNKKLASTRFSLSASLLLAGSLAMSPAHAVGGAEPLTEILTAPGSAGLGLAARIATSPYRGAGTRGDLLPLYLYEGERFFLHANRLGVKLLDKGDRDNGQRLDLFVEQRLEGFTADHLPASLASLAGMRAAHDA